jgi:hypothetical protein
MSTGDGSENGNQDDENGTGSDGVAEKSESDILRQTFGRDTGADDRRDQ